MSRRHQRNAANMHIESVRPGEFVAAKINRRVELVQIWVEGRHDKDDVAVAATLLDAAGVDKLITRLQRVRKHMQ